MTRFFEPINASATHIYHSALELSPLSSTVRKLYYHHRLAPFPRVEAGIPDLQDLGISIPCSRFYPESVTWSPCGQFIAIHEAEAVEIRNGLTLELVSTLRPAIRDARLPAPLSYHPDGHSLACVTNTGIIIWDIQTGGVVKEIPWNTEGCSELAWLSDGQVVGFLFNQTVLMYNVASSTTLPSIPLKSHCCFFWAHNGSFWVMKKIGDSGSRVSIHEVWPTSTGIESFSIMDGAGHLSFKSFSPATYRISGIDSEKRPQLFIWDLRRSGRLLAEKGQFISCSFSPDGGYFAAFKLGVIHIWNYSGTHYIPWQQLSSPAYCLSTSFSPTLSSIVVCQQDCFRLWHLNHPPTAPAENIPHLDIFSPSGTQIATACYQGRTVTITSLTSQTPSQYIDVGMKIVGFGLTGKVLLVKGASKVMAWLLTEEGGVSTVPGKKRASIGDSIWTMPLPPHSKPRFLVEGDTGAIKCGETPWIYNATTGGVLVPQHPPHFQGPWYTFEDNLQVKDYHSGSPLQNSHPKAEEKPTQTKLKEGWMRDEEGTYLLWIPTEWRVSQGYVQWFSDSSIMNFRGQFDNPIIIKLQ